MTIKVNGKIANLDILDDGTGRTLLTGQTQLDGSLDQIDAYLVAITADDAQTNAKLANMAANTVKANNTGSTGDPTDVAIGAAQTLQRGTSGNLAATSPTRLVSQTASDVTVASSVTETDLASHTVPAGLVVPGDLLTFLAWGDILSNDTTNPATFLFRARLAGSSNALTAAVSYAKASGKYRWRYQWDILVGAAVTAQDTTQRLDVGAAAGGSTTMGVIDAAKSHVHAGTGAANMANSTAVSFQVTQGTSSATVVTVCSGSLLTLTRNL